MDMAGCDFDTTVLVAIDFDGTLTKEDRYPDTVFELDEIAIEYAKRIREMGANLILRTCRTDGKLDEALTALESTGLVFDYVNNGNGLRHDDGLKINADIYIDDKANDGRIRWHRIMSRIELLIRSRREISDTEL